MTPEPGAPRGVASAATVAVGPTPNLEDETMITRSDQIDGARYRPVNLAWLREHDSQPVYDTEEEALADAAKLEARGVEVVLQQTRRKRFVSGRSQDEDDHWEVVAGSQWWLYVDRETYARLDAAWQQYLAWRPYRGCPSHERAAKRDELIRIQ